ncbi:Cobyrinic acid ac-diamide synthase [Desulfovibrio sp. X2]|uniref:ParA family protein n=1 Tax=Desulfovibrio sp. X2 TaxID=941449 RepID=UPI000358BCB3|nr:ParA family protein [Desulfovibrio sp. X2]EPR37305.1 Cobyrinic acid ac-diamide synthase [Desulfovibrio sp. X2]
MTAKVVAIANQKGGVGKTTTALTLGAALSRLSQRVLIMDMDPHANASIHMAFFPEETPHTLYDLFAEKEHDPAIWERIIVRHPESERDFVTGHIRLSELEVDTKDRPNKGLILREALKDVSGRYDYILLDCPPHVGVLLVNALVACDLLIIPVQTDFLALHGLRLIFDTVRMINRVMPEPVRFKALATMYDRRASACRRVLNLIRKKLQGNMFNTVINTDTKFREASAQGKVIYDIDPQSRGATEYTLLAKEIMQL